MCCCIVPCLCCVCSCSALPGRTTAFRTLSVVLTTVFLLYTQSQALTRTRPRRSFVSCRESVPGTARATSADVVSKKARI